MLDPESNVAEQLANAIKHHQRNLVERKQAEDKVEMLQRMVAQLEELSGETEDKNED